MDQLNQTDDRDNDIDVILNEHRLRRRAFLNKAMLAPTVATSTGLLANLVYAGAAWGQVNVTVTTLFTTVPVTTLVNSPTTTLVNFPTTTLVNFPTTTLVNFPTTTLVNFPTTTLVNSPTTTLVTFPVTTLLTIPPTTTFVFTTEPPITDTMPITGPTDPHTVPEPPTLVLVATGIVAALALSARYRAAAEPAASEQTAAGQPDN